MHKFVFINTGRGRRIILFKGNRYYYSKTNTSGSTIWICHKRVCRATITIHEEEETVSRESLHLCEPDKKSNLVEQALAECILKMQTDLGPILQIYEKAMTSDESYADVIPKFDSVQDTLYSSRKKILGVQKTNFSETKDVIIPDIFKDFLIIEDGDPKILVFANSSVFESLQNIKHYFADGTFFVVPRPFYQLYTIQGDVGSTDDKTLIVPLFFAFLPKKEQITYEVEVIQVIANTVPIHETNRVSDRL